MCDMIILKQFMKRLSASLFTRQNALKQCKSMKTGITLLSGCADH